MTSPLLETRGVYYRYSPSHWAIENATLRLEEESRLVILGPNGGGKTTLLHILSTLLTPQRGEVLFRGRRVKRGELVGRVGLLMQDPTNQIFMPRVWEDVAFGARNRGFEDTEVKTRVEEALEVMGIGHLRDRVPFSLSGGEIKRVALAGVLAAGAEVLLLDEPTSGLDPLGEMRLLKELKRLHYPMVVTTHSPEVAAELATEVVVLKKSIVMAGPPREVLTDLKRLKKYGLRPPRVTEAFLRAGVTSPPLTPPQAARLIKEFKS